MPVIKIRDNRTGAVIFAGLYPDLRACAEAAVAQGRPLDNADLSHANLANAALDGGSFRGARFAGANLSGANMSEAQCAAADFTGAALYNACLCLADLSGCRFEEAAFGATDIAGAYLQDCIFSTLSTFSLGFTAAARIERCVFLNPDGKACEFSRPPVVVSGLEYPVVLFDRHIKVGGSLRDIAQWLDSWRNGAESTNDNLPPDETGRALDGFLLRYREALLFLGAARLPLYRAAAPLPGARRLRAAPG
jgi:uncharacterized protein YjbI with pentapeptide repeats